jgi:membrane protease subunit HflC
MKVQNKMRKFIVITIIIVLLVSLVDTFFIVDQGSQAIVLQFGKVVNEDLINPGLHFKYPFINKVVYFEKKILGFSSETREAIASDQKRVLVNTYTKYRITDPLQFYRSVRTEQNLSNRVSPIIESSTREAIAKTNLNCFVAECRVEATQFIKENASNNTKDFGIKIIDVRIKTVALPNENLESIFSRMKTDRNKEAKEIRATGTQENNIITSTADKDKVFIISDAQLKAAKLRGEADAKAATIYNDAFSKDLGYFEYIKYLEMYKKSLKSEDVIFIMSGDNEYLKFLFKKK